MCTQKQLLPPFKVALSRFTEQNGFKAHKGVFDRFNAGLTQRLWIEKRRGKFSLYVLFLVGEAIARDKFDWDAEYHPGVYSKRHPDHARFNSAEFQIAENDADLEDRVSQVLSFFEADILPILTDLHSLEDLRTAMDRTEEWRGKGVWILLKTYDLLNVPRPC
jgi:hypothetical protein